MEVPLSTSRMEDRRFLLRVLQMGLWVVEDMRFLTRILVALEYLLGCKTFIAPIPIYDVIHHILFLRMSCILTIVRDLSLGFIMN